MSENVPKSRISHFTNFALLAFVLLGGFYLTSRIQHWHVSWPSLKTDTAVSVNAESPEQRANEYQAYKQVFQDKVQAYKALLARDDNSAMLKLLSERLSVLATIEADYIKLRPTATEPDRIKLRKMVGEYSTIYDQLVKLDYQFISIREARGEVTDVHTILMLTSPKHYADDKPSVKKILKDADVGTYNIYQVGALKKKIDFLTEIALSRLKPTEQDATPEMRLQAGMEAIELYLNELTARNKPPKPASD